MCDIRLDKRPAGPWPLSLVIAVLSVAAGLGPIFGATPVSAETLTQALSAAYIDNPTLRAERAGVRATDETVSQALAGWRPTVTSSGDYGRSRATNKPGGKVKTKPHGVGVGITQPIFRGLRTVNSTRQADASVIAARHTLTNVEQTVLLNAVTAFMNVVRDQAIIRLRTKNVAVLQEQLRASRARFKVGDITRTDVAQSRARLSGSVSLLSLARANLASSRANYAQIIGKPPGTLRNRRSVSGLLPRNFNEALTTARKQNPTLLAALYNERASNHAIAVAKGSILPEVSVEARYDRRYNPSGLIRRSETASVIGRLDVPLYQSGAEYSRVRQAKQVNSQRRLQITEAERSVRAEVISAWEGLRASRQTVRANRSQVTANTLALRGVREEARVGSRTTLDVLNAEQELVDSSVSLATSRRDEVVATYRLLAATGRLTAGHLRLPVPVYNPAKHHKKVRGKWIGFGTR